MYKRQPYASQITSEAAAKEAYDLGMRHVNVYIKGPGAGRDAAIRALQGAVLMFVPLRI